MGVALFPIRFHDLPSLVERHTPFSPPAQIEPSVARWSDQICVSNPFAEPAPQHRALAQHEPYSIRGEQEGRLPVRRSADPHTGVAGDGHAERYRLGDGRARKLQGRGKTRWHGPE